MESPSTSAPDHRGETNNLKKSHYLKTVCLADWWLVKAENEVQGRRLAVAGISEKGKQAVRVFTSAPILKRYDDFTMKTTDGIYVVLNGFINKTRTLENGFPSDIFNYFLFGFPPQWKEYDEKLVGKEHPSEDIMRDKHREQLTQQLGSMDGAQPHVDSSEKDSTPQLKIKATDRQKSKRTKSFSVALRQRCSSSGLQYSGGTSVEDHTAPKLPVKCLVNEDTCIREIKTRSKTHKAKNKATESPCTPVASIKSPCTPAASTKSPHAPETVVTGNNSLLANAKAKDLDLKTVQKCTPVRKKTPKSKQKKGCSPSPESQSLKRSRSGRLLMHPLEYWRNQRAIYGADRTITGIEDATLTT